MALPSQPAAPAKQSFAELRSQAELGNERERTFGTHRFSEAEWHRFTEAEWHHFSEAEWHAILHELALTLHNRPRHRRSRASADQQATQQATALDHVLAEHLWQ